MGVIFLVGIHACVWTQLVGLVVYRDLIHRPGDVQAVMNVTKTHFVVLMTFLTSWINPCKVKMTWDSSVNPSMFRRDFGGNLISNLSPNSVFISNHQIYTDWLFLWFISYTSRLSDSVHIILKDLSKIPILGYGMKNFNFLFLSRKWENDKVVLTNQLNEIDANARGMGPANGVVQVANHNSSTIKWPQGKTDQVWPYQLILFPEGTVTSLRTVKKSAEFCSSINLERMEHVLLPRIRGLFLALRKLRNSVEVVYDFTTAYSDLLPEEFGEDKFSLKRFYIRGHGPPVVNYYVRTYKISDIPLGTDTDDIDDADPKDLAAFEKWLYTIWEEKDDLMKYFYKHGTFTNESKSTEETVVADYKLRNSLEVFTPFITLFSALMILRLIWIAIWKLVG